jgi:threonine dehydratase
MNLSMTRDQLAEVRAFLTPHLHRTPLLRSGALSTLAGCEVYVKAELFQKTGSYKPRGMLWALHRMSEQQRSAGVITFSAGNAAQGLAFAARLQGVSATVVMPATASPTKAQATREYGAEVVLHGTPSECLDHCMNLVQERGLSFVSSYDDEALMSGHASLGAEILEDLPDVSAIYVGIGGGGMAGGLVNALEATDSPARLIGVEPTGAPGMYESFAAGHAVRLSSVKTIADGLAAPSAGALCYALAKRRLEAIRLVDDDAIAAAMKLLMARCKLFVEPAGAAALAGLLAAPGTHGRNHKVVVVASGGNVDFDRLKVLL